MRPAFKSCFRVEVVEPDGIYVLAENTQHLLRGSVYCQLAACLDGTTEVDDLVDRLSDRADPAELYYALSVLENRGFITDGASPPDPAAAYWERLGHSAAAARDRLAAARVEVVAIGEAGAAAERLSVMLRASGIGQQMRATEPTASISVVVAEDYLLPALRAVNAEALKTGRPWLLVKPTGAEIWIGPLFRPGVTGCWECLAQRLRGNRRVESYIQQRRGLAAPVTIPTAALPCTTDAALQILVTQLAQLLSGHAVAIDGAVVSIDLVSLASSRHPLTRRPQCPACGAPQVAAPSAASRLERRTGRRIEEGRHGTALPAATLARYQHHVSPITGVAAMLQPLEGEADLPPVYLAGHNFAFPAHDLRSLRRGLRSSSSGKGASEEQARASALCEALERYSGVYQGDETRIRASYRELGDVAVHPADCLLFSAAQYAERAAWNARDSQFSRVPAPFDIDARLDWTPVWSLTDAAPRHVLTAYCYYGYRPDPGMEVYCWADSNGCAAGNTLEEAILHGLFELVERDAVAVWWYNRLRRPGLDIGSFASPYLEALRRSYARRGREIWALDLTGDLGIPVVVVVSRVVSERRERLMFGFGAHLDPAIALVRAAAELNQCLVRAVSGGADREDNSDFADENFRHWWAGATLAAQPHLAPDPTRPARRQADFPAWQSDDILDDIEHCRRVIERGGMRLLVLDQTRPDIALPVARVIVPGLRHFWPRFGAGRLYDVPVRSGELSRPFEEAELNPVAMFI